MKKRTRDICRGTPVIEFEQDSVSLGTTLGAGQKLKTIFLVSAVFPGKADSVILLVFEYTVNPQNLSKLLEPFLRKSKFSFFFFLM